MEDQSRPHERRRSVRLNASCPCIYTRFDNDGKPYDQRPSRSVNLSLGGVALQSNFRVETGETLKISMALGDDQISFRGKVVHVTPTEDQAFRFGISIRDIGKMDKIALTRFIYYFKPSKAS